MLPNSNEKVKDSFLKKGTTKHRRSNSISSETNSIPVQSTFNLEKRGWLVEPSATPVVTPSRSLDTRKQANAVQPATATIKKPVIKDISQKDILGAVSDEDIFKLTELTTRLPEVNKTLTNKHYKNRSDKENNENITRKRKESVDEDLVTRSDKVISQQQLNRPGIRHPSFSSPGLPLLSTLSDTSDDTRRKSWLYKSLIKPYKSKSNSNKSNSTKYSTGSNIEFTSEAASIVEKYYHERANELLKKDHTRSNSSNQQLQQASEASTSHDMNRRHSFDNFQHAVDDERPYMSKEEEDQMLSDLVQSQEFIEHHDEALAKWDEEQKQERNFMHDKRSDFNLSIPSNIQNDFNQSSETDDDDDEKDEKDEGNRQEDLQLLDTPIIITEDYSESGHEDNEKETVFMFDYFSLPTEVKLLIDQYEHKGKVERKNMIVKYKDDDDEDDDEEDGIVKTKEGMSNEAGSSKEEDKGDEEDDDNNEEQVEENVVDYRDLIIGNDFDEISNSQRDTRSIAVVTVTRSDNIEFTKLIQVAMGESSDNGPLLDLHVSLFGDDTREDNNNNTHQEEFEETIQSIEKSLEKLECFKTESEAFLRNHMDTMESLNLYTSYSIPRNLSFPNLCSILNEDETKLYEEPESISSGSSLSLSSNGSNSQVRRDGPARRAVYSRNTQSMYAGNTESRDPFDQRQKDIMILVSSLKKDLDTFKVGLTKSEELVNDVQTDMNDTRNCMETYIKDIPESHYSALKKLEVDIESILSKRTKNPWLDTGYAVLSYLLTMFALVVWIIIYVLKWGKKVVMFPRKLWRVYSEYLVERNEAVIEASMLSVSGGTGTRTEENNGISVSSSIAAGIHSDTLFQRPMRETQKD